MGQAKLRGSKAERIAKATRNYQERLEELSQYGLSVEVLDEHFKGNEALVVYHLHQITNILNHHDDVVKVRLLINDGKLGLDVETTGVHQNLGEHQHELMAVLDAIDERLKPKNMTYYILFANAPKSKVVEIYSEDNDKPFDLKLGRDKDYFYNFLAAHITDMREDELTYYAEIIAAYSNHLFSDGKEQSFIFRKEVRMS